MQSDRADKNTLAILLLNYNGMELLHKFMPTIVDSIDPGSAVLYVIDNASDDGSVDFLKHNYPDIPVVEFDVNYGYTGGFNRAVHLIKADFYLTLSTDVEVTDRWYLPMLNLMIKDPTIGACQPKIRSFHDRNSFEYAGVAGGYMDRWGYLFCRGRLFDHIEADEGQYDKSVDVFWAGGCSLMVRGDVYKKLKGFEDAFFAHFEEVDLCWRIGRLGYRVVACMDAVVFHVGGSTLNYRDPYKLFLNTRNNLIMLVKNWPTVYLITRLPVRLILDILGAFYFLFNRGVPAFFAVLKAHLAFYLGLHKWIKLRKMTQGKTVIPTEHTVYGGSIIWSYFLRRKVRFTELNWKQ